MAGGGNFITIRFNVDGVVEHTENGVQTLTNVVLLDLYKPSVRYGYRFDGWYAESNFATKIENAAQIPVNMSTTDYDVYGRFVELNMNNTVQTADIHRVMYNNELMLEVVYNDVVVWPLDRAGYDYSYDRHPYLRYCELYDVLLNSNSSYIDTYYPITELDRLKFLLSVNFLNSGSGSSSNGMYYNIPRLQFDIERGMAHWGVGNEYGYSEPIQTNQRIDYMYDITTNPFLIEITQGSYVYTASGRYSKKTISPSDNASVIIFARRSSNTGVLYNYTGYFYEFKLWEDGVLIRDFKPCKLKTDIEANMSYDNTSKRSGTVGAWDLSNNKFVPFTNKSGNERVFNL